MQLVIVKRGRFSTFRALSDHLPGDETRLIWDRRSGSERRQAAVPVPSEERRRDRRRPPDALWNTMGYCIAKAPELPS
jgi:hypothetical protein